MHLRQLEYFVACAELLNFTRAAERCFITQTAMTQQIRSLEDTLGVKLFIRDKHHVELTRAGALFYNEAKTILRRSEAAVRMIQNADSSEVGHIAVGFIRGYGHSDLAKVLHMFHRAHPGVDVDLVRDNEFYLLEQLEKGDLDMVFSVTPYAGLQVGIDRQLLKQYRLMVVMNIDHPLAGKPFLTYQDLRDENFLLMQPAGRSGAETEEAMFIYDRGGYLPNIVAMEAELETLLLYVAIGKGISILPEYALTHIHRREDIRVVPLVKEDQSAETLNFEVLWRADQDNPALRGLVDMVRSVE